MHYSSLSTNLGRVVRKPLPNLWLWEEIVQNLWLVWVLDDFIKTKKPDSKEFFIGSYEEKSSYRCGGCTPAHSLMSQGLFARREGYFCVEPLPGFVQPFLHSSWHDCKGESNSTGVFLCQGGAFFLETISIVWNFWLWRRCLSSLTMRTVNFSFEEMCDAQAALQALFLIFPGAVSLF